MHAFNCFKVRNRQCGFFSAAALLGLCLTLPWGLSGSGAWAEEPAPGSLDTSFGTGGLVGTTFRGIAYETVVLPDGKILVAGETVNEGRPVDDRPQGSDFILMRFNADGSVDTTFGNNGQVVTDFMGFGSSIEENYSSDHGRAMEVQADGKIIMVGHHGNNSKDWLIARYHTNGSLDVDFGVGGKQSINFNGHTYSYAYDVDILPDGKFLVTGLAHYDFAVMKFNADGTTDTSFGTEGVFWQLFNFDLPGVKAFGREYVYDLVVQPDGKLVIGGSVPHISRYYGDVFGLIRLNSNGTLDPTFGTNGQVVFPKTYGKLYKLAVLPNGDILGIGAVVSMQMFRVKSDGSLDPTFGTNGVVITGMDGPSPFDPDRPGLTEAWGLAVQDDGKFTVVGHTNSLTAVGENRGWCIGMIRFNSDGSPDTTFGNTGNGQVRTDFDFTDEFFYGVDVQPDGRLVVVGTTGPMGSTKSNIALARYHGDGGIAGNTDPVIDSPPTATPDPAELNEVVAFQVGATDAENDTLTYTWTFGDGTGALGMTPLHTYNVSGTYTVTLSVTDGNGGSANSTFDLVVNDSVAPQLEVTGIVLKGNVSDASGIGSLKVDGQLVTVQTDGSWQHEVSLSASDTSVNIEVTDGVGNVTVRTVIVKK